MAEEEEVTFNPLYQNTEEDHPDPIEAEITGTVPVWLSGSLYRNGPAMFSLGGNSYNHWFDGMAVIHKFNINQGKVTYQNRFVESDDYKTNVAAKRLVTPGFGTVAFPDPCKTLFQRFLSYFTPVTSDNCVVNVMPFGDQLYAVSEPPVMHRFHKDSLETLAKVDIDKLIAVNLVTAHAHTDPDGTLHNIGTSFKGAPSGGGRGTHYCFIKIPPPENEESPPFEKAELVAEIPASSSLYPSYFHSFAMTENYYVYMEQPYTLNLPKTLLAKFLGLTNVECFEWTAGVEVRFHIVDKKSGEIVNKQYRYVSDTFAFFHHANAYEEEGHLVLDVCASGGDDKMYGGAVLEMLRSSGQRLREAVECMPKSTLRRFVLPLHLDDSTPQGENLVKLDYTTATASLNSQQQVKLTQDTLGKGTYFEFPQINYGSYNCKKYQYVYGLDLFSLEAAEFCSAVVKVDVQSQETRRWSENGAHAGEPVFVARPGGEKEDDGVLLSPVITNGSDSKTYLLVLDAKDMTEIARVNIPFRIPRDLHGIFVTDK